MTSREFDQLINDICDRKKINGYQISMICHHVNNLQSSLRACKSSYTELCQYLKERDLFKDVIRWRKEKK